MSASEVHDVGVVIVTYNSAGTIAACLGALPRGELASVIVVDNASNDATVETVRVTAPDVEVLALPANLGFGAGCNRGAELLPGDVAAVLFLNPDAVLERDGLAVLRAYLRSTPRAALVAPVLRSNGEYVTSSGDVPSLRSELRFAVPPRFASRFPERRHEPGARETGPVGVVEGACMLVDRTVLAEIGGFDERFFLFFEEADLAMRLRSVGREAHLVTAAVADHAVGASRATVPLTGRDRYLESTVQYLSKWHGPAAASLFRAVAISSIWVRARFGSMRRDDAERLRRALRRRRPGAPRRGLFVAWSRQPRSAHVANALGAQVHMVTVGRHGQRALVPFRYAAQTAATLRALVRERPRVVIAMCPPLALGILACAYAFATGATFAIDAHTAALFRRGRVRRSIRFFDARGCVVIVASPHIADRLEAEGLSRPSPLHDPLPDCAAAAGATTPRAARPLVVVPLGWSPDEPIAEIVEAARSMPDVDVVLTGRPRGAGAGLTLPPNVRRTGHVSSASYDSLVASAAVMLAVTTRPFTMLRAGYEAVAAHVPVVVSDTPTLRDYFGEAAVYAAPDRDSLHRALREALDRHDELVGLVSALAARHRTEHAAAAAALRGRLGVNGREGAAARATSPS